MTSQHSSSSVWHKCGPVLCTLLLALVVGAHGTVLDAQVSIEMPSKGGENFPSGGPGEVELKPDRTLDPPGDDPPSSTRKAAERKRDSIKKVQVEIKLKDENGDPLPPPGRYIRITEITYQDEDGVSHTVSTGGTGPANRSSIDLPADADLTKPVTVKWEFVRQIGSDPNTGEPIWQVADPDEDVNLNFRYLNSAASIVVSAEVGPANTYFASDVEGDPLSITDVAAQHFGLSASDYDTPDLMFHTGVSLDTGLIYFTPVGQFRFTGLPAAIHVFDRYGNDLLDAEQVVLGEPYLSERGDLVVPVHEADPEILAVAVLVRGTALELDGDADGDSVHGYTVTGSSLGYRPTNIAAIADGTRVLDNWEILPFSNSYGFGSIDAPVGMSDVQSFGRPFITVVQSEPSDGFLRGIVIEGESAGSITTGSIVLRGMAGLRFLATEDTKLYVVDADTGSNVSGSVTASLSVNTHGDLVVTLDDLGSVASSRLKIAVIAPKASILVNLPHGRGLNVAAFGSSLKAPTVVTETILEGGREDLIDLGPLATTPAEITGSGWDPAATCD